MAISTYTLLRTYTSVEIISTTVTAPVETETPTADPEPATVVHSVEEPIADPSSNTPLFAKRPTDAIGGNQNPQPPTTAPSGFPPPIESSLPTTVQTISQDAPQPTQESTREAAESNTSQSIEKAILQPVPGTNTVATTSSSASSNPSNLSSAISTTFQTLSESTTAASAPQSTQSSDNSTPDDSDSGITNPQSTFTTATLPGGRPTTIGLDATAASDHSSSPSETSLNVTDSDASDSPSTPVLVGGIFGAFAAISLILCLWWLVRKRMSKKRRSTLLTPLSLPAGGRGGMGGEKKYEIDTASLGPTPRSTKWAAALSFYPKKFSEKLGHLPTNNSSNGVNMNRGNSQFLDPVPSHSRSSSVEGHSQARGGSGRPGWWSRVIEDTSSEDLMAQDMAERANQPGLAYVPSMDESRPDREAQQRRISRGHSVSSWTDGARSPNPFADANTLSAVSSTKYYPAPLRPNNPFADSNSIAPPATAQVAPAGYVQDVQRSRRQSGPMVRDSAATRTSFETRRNKTHSNPFDLEIDGPQPSMGPNMQRPPRVPVASSIYDMPRPASGRTRAESYTSRYASGPGLPPGDWSTMGPVSSRWGSTVGYVPIGHVRNESDDSIIGSSGVGHPGVGQAM
ncbi:hypothetical protein AUP68_16144 [Ilyonectria robusta]